MLTIVTNIILYKNMDIHYFLTSIIKSDDH